MLVGKWKSREIAKKNSHLPPQVHFPRFIPLEGSPDVIAKNLAVFHYELHISQNLDIA